MVRLRQALLCESRAGSGSNKAARQATSAYGRRASRWVMSLGEDDEMAMVMMRLWMWMWMQGGGQRRVIAGVFVCSWGGSYEG